MIKLLNRFLKTVLITSATLVMLMGVVTTVSSTTGYGVEKASADHKRSIIEAYTYTDGYGIIHRVFEIVDYSDDGSSWIVGVYETTDEEPVQHSVICNPQDYPENSWECPGSESNP